MQLSKTDIIKIISILKGIAISLVVFLHWDGRTDFNSETFNQVSLFLSPLRMPVFIFASGFLYFYITKSRYPEYSKFILEKGKRLLIPLLSIKLLYFFIKFVAGSVLTHDFVMVETGIKSFIVDLFVYPASSLYAGFLWFVYTLFFVFAIVHLLSSNYKILLIVSAIVFFIPLPQEFCLDRIGEYLFFFALGGVPFNYLPVIKITKRTIPALFIVLISSIGVIALLYSAYSEYYLIDRFLQLVRYTGGILFVLSLSVLLAKSDNMTARVLAYIGTFSASIYFLHTIACRVFAVIGNQLVHIGSEFAFWVYLFFAMLVGIIVPILLDKYFFSKSYLAGFLILGKKPDRANPKAIICNLNYWRLG